MFGFIKRFLHRKSIEKIRLKGEIVLRKIDRKGRVIEERRIRNLIVNVGKAQIAGLINGIVTSPFKYVAIGTGTTAESSSDTGLEAEIARKQATVSRKTTNVTNDTSVWEVTFSSEDGLSGTSSVTEAGIFDSSTGGNMLSRKTFSAVNLDWDAGDSLQITWEITVQ